jgi:hypothetical protein
MRIQEIIVRMDELNDLRCRLLKLLVEFLTASAERQAEIKSEQDKIIAKFELFSLRYEN